MSNPGPNRDRCPHCQAEIDGSDATHCWLCEQALDRPAPSVKAPRPPVAAAWRTAGPSGLMLVITLIAVVLGVYREAPGLGILLAVTVAPALVWAVAVVARDEAKQGRPLPALEKVTVFVFALAAVFAIWISAFVAFVITCLSNTDLGGAAASRLANVAAVVTAVVVGLIAHLRIRRPWRRKDR